MKVNKSVVALAIAAVGYYKYKKFQDFINNLKLGLDVVSIDNGFADVVINNLNTMHIPYAFTSVNLIKDKNVNAAVNTETKTNLSIVPASQIPITFKLLQNFSVQELETTEIAIKYNFFGFNFERLYTPTINAQNVNIGKVELKSKTGSKCGCKI